MLGFVFLSKLQRFNFTQKPKSKNSKMAEIFISAPFVLFLILSHTSCLIIFRYFSIHVCVNLTILDIFQATHKKLENSQSFKELSRRSTKSHVLVRDLATSHRTKPIVLKIVNISMAPLIGQQLCLSKSLLSSGKCEQKSWMMKNYGKVKKSCCQDVPRTKPTVFLTFDLPRGHSLYNSEISCSIALPLTHFRIVDSFTEKQITEILNEDIYRIQWQSL